MRMRLTTVVTACALLCSPILARAAESEPATAQLSADQRAAALSAIEAAFRDKYVFPEMRPKILERLSTARSSGRYDVDDPRAFADRVTEDLQEVSHDKHVWMRVDPAAYAAASAPPDSDAGEEAYWRRQALRNNHGLTEMKILGGNIRYLKISGFEWVADVTGTAYDGAMRFLSGGDAAVIDLRGNGGGTHESVRYLVSHFLPGDVLEMTFLQGSKPPEQSRTLDHLAAGRLQGKPLYVLIDGGVASAAEAFAYDVQQFKLGELVGTRTAGAANNNELLPVAPEFILSISYGRPVHALSNANWEGEGVAPTLEASSEQALQVAQVHALARLSREPGATDEQRRDYAWAQVAAEASLHPIAVQAGRLRGLAGRYGRYEVTLRDGALWLARPNRPTARLSALSADGLFAIDSVDSVRVRLTGKALELLRADEPSPRVFPRG
ncbi:MAG TPA: S41 family peptidase [Steroidobacteraceae bacterium]|nr:S41 family peptidase [Steroidobacteraceae bacterium]